MNLPTFGVAPNKKKTVFIIAMIVLFGTSIAAAYHFILGNFLNLSYPFDTFLFIAHARFSDFRIIILEGVDLNPYMANHSGQYPFMVILGFLFSLFRPYHFAVYLIIICYFILIIGKMFIQTGSKVKDWLYTFIIIFLSYPMLFGLDRGNFEILLFIFLLAFLYFFLQKKYILSAIFLSFAIAMKIYPAILLFLFIPEKKYRAFLIGGISFVILTIGSFMLFQGGWQNNLEFLLNSSNISSNKYFLNFLSARADALTQRGVTLLTLVKIFSTETGMIPDLLADQISRSYFWAAIISFIPVITHVLFIEKDFWKRLALLTFAMLLLPSISADYKLVHVFLPLFAYLFSPHKDPLDVVYTILFGLLLIPKDYFFFPKVLSDTNYHDISIAVPINILNMLLFSALIMGSGLLKHLKKPVSADNASAA